MAEKKEKFLGQMLSAEQLLENKGLKYTAWDEYEKSAKTLPKSGMKQFEPDNSWLENMQIEKGIISRKNLIAVERVNRVSQLASAEWLPVQKRAKVKKYSGQDWNNFGLEKNGILYLLPEEALFLLEANCLELIWNDVPISIQQAYNLLIDDTECSLEEYRVYSQLLRHGYRVQRFTYNSEKNSKVDRNGGKRRKVIVDPENGLWRTDNQETKKNSTNNNDPPTECLDNIIQKIVHEVVNDLLCTIENIEAQATNIESQMLMKNQNKLDTVSEVVDTHTDKRKRKSKVEIISKESFSNRIKVVVNHKCDNINDGSPSMNWRASRIQRNVKLLPKRTDKILSLSEKLNCNIKSSEEFSGKYKFTSMSGSTIETEKSKQEVIEISDDEIQEVPKPMTRMDFLNLIPNIATNSLASLKVSKAYIPRNIKPCKISYNYECSRLRNLQEIDKRLKCNKKLEDLSNNTRHSGHMYSNASTSNNSRNSTSVLPTNQNVSNLYGQHRNTIFGNLFLVPNNYKDTIYQDRSVTVQKRNTLVPNLDNVQDQWRSHLSRNYYGKPNTWNHKGKMYQPSFKIVPGTSSWSELKSKWREGKTITIDDDDTEKVEECNEVQVVRQLRSPLVGPKNASSLEEVFSKLQIIKSAPEKAVRKKKNKYKISYNVYSSTQNYRKSNPGLPFYRIVVIRQDDPFIQPIELQRLLQDADNSPIVLACVSMSISYIQPGFISVPNLT